MNVCSIVETLKGGGITKNFLLALGLCSMFGGVKCIRCNSKERVKRGIVNHKQRYTCKNCGYNYTVEQKSTAYPLRVKRQALQLYLEGLGFRSIGRYLGVSHVAVYHWIKSFGEKVNEIKSETTVEMVEIDEMHTYIGDKKTIVGSGLLLIDMGKGSSISSWATGRQEQDGSYGTH